MGAEIVNDVSGLHWDPEMAGVVADLQPGVVLMHARGRPRDWAALPALLPQEVLPLVLSGLRESVAVARAIGIASSRIVLDPGFGFGKIRTSCSTPRSTRCTPLAFPCSSDPRASASSPRDWQTLETSHG
jgi:dihydropteroate synthase